MENEFEYIRLKMLKNYATHAISTVFNPFFHFRRLPKSTFTALGDVPLFSGEVTYGCFSVMKSNIFSAFKKQA